MDREADWRKVRDLAKAWLAQDCPRNCEKCIARIQEIADLAEDAVRAVDGPLRLLRASTIGH